MGMARIFRMAPSLGPGLSRLALLAGTACALGCGGGGAAAPSSTPMPAVMATRAWTHAEALQSEDPSAAMDASGQTVVAWSQISGPHRVIEVQWLLTGSSPAALSDPTVDAWTPKVGLDGSGNALVVYSQYDGGTQAHVWARRNTGNGWSAPVQVSQNALADASAPFLGCDASGQAWVLWHQGNGVANHFDIWGARFSSGAWATPVRLSDGVKSAYNPRIAMNASGQALAVWTQAQDDGSVSNGPQDTWSSTYAVGGSWSAPQQINSVDGAHATVYGVTAIATDALGRGVALWIQVDATGTGAFQCWAAAYQPGSGWATAQQVSLSGGGDSYAPSVALDAQGTAMAVWQQQDGISAADIAASRFTFGGSWTSPQLISSGALAFDPHVLLNANGLATAVWYQMDAPSYTIRSASCPTTTWSAPALIDGLADPNGFYYPVSCLAGNGTTSPNLIWGMDSY